MIGKGEVNTMFHTIMAVGWSTGLQQSCYFNFEIFQKLLRSNMCYRLSHSINIMRSVWIKLIIQIAGCRIATSMFLIQKVWHGFQGMKFYNPRYPWWRLLTFPRAVIANDHKCGNWQKQKLSLSLLWRPEIWNQVVSRAMNSVFFASS